MDVCRSICFCQRRIDAMTANEFRWSHELRGWYFLEAERRAPHYPATSDTRGFPYVFECCPFCGHDLPGVPAVTSSSDATGSQEVE